jgi:hypothetical protein
MKIPPRFVSGCNQDVLGKSWALERKALACEARESHVAVFGGGFNSNELAISSENHRKIIGKP